MTRILFCPSSSAKRHQSSYGTVSIINHAKAKEPRGTYDMPRLTPTMMFELIACIYPIQHLKLGGFVDELVSSRPGVMIAKRALQDHLGSHRRILGRTTYTGAVWKNKTQLFQREV
jgi:hypothetical protein